MSRFLSQTEPTGGLRPAHQGLGEVHAQLHRTEKRPTNGGSSIWALGLLSIALHGCGGQTGATEQSEEANPPSIGGGSSSDDGGGDGGSSDGGGGNLETSFSENTTANETKSHGVFGASPFSCDDCSNFSTFSIFYDSRVSDFIYDGTSLLVRHELPSYGEHEIDWLSISEQADSARILDSAALTRLYLDQGEPILISWGTDGTDESTLVLRTFANDFEPFQLPFDTRVDPRQIKDDQLCIGLIENESWTYSAGPLHGPFEPLARGVLVPDTSSTVVQGEECTVATFRRVSESGVIMVHLGDDESPSLTIEDMTGAPWSVWMNKGGLVVTGVQAGQQTLWWDGGSRTLGAVDQPPDYDCSESHTAYAPDVCPYTSEPLGLRSDVVLSSALALDDEGSLWAARVTGDRHDQCRWATLNACFESLPCDCQQQVSSTSEPHRLIIERAIDGSDRIVFDLEEFDRTPQVRLSINGTRVSVLLADISYGSTFFGMDFDLAESQ